MQTNVIWTVVGALSVVAACCMQMLHRRKKGGIGKPSADLKSTASKGIFSPNGQYALRIFAGNGRLFSFEEFREYVNTVPTDDDVGSSAWASADGEWVDLKTGRWIPVQPAEIRKGERPESFFTHIRHYGGRVQDLLAGRSILFPPWNYEIRAFESVKTLYCLDAFKRRLATEGAPSRDEVVCWASAYGEWVEMPARKWIRADIDAIRAGHQPQPYFTHINCYKTIDKSLFSGSKHEVLAADGEYYLIRPFDFRADLIPLQEFRDLLKRYSFSEGSAYWASADGEWVRLEIGSRIRVNPYEVREGLIPEPFFTHVHFYSK